MGVPLSYYPQERANFMGLLTALLTPRRRTDTRRIRLFEHRSLNEPVTRQCIVNSVVNEQSEWLWLFKVSIFTDFGIFLILSLITLTYPRILRLLVSYLFQPRRCSLSRPFHIRQINLGSNRKSSSNTLNRTRFQKFLNLEIGLPLSSTSGRSHRVT